MGIAMAVELTRLLAAEMLWTRKTRNMAWQMP